MAKTSEKAPATERRVKDAESARKIYVSLAKDNRRRSEVFAQVSNQLEGGRPWDPAQQQRDGMAWSCNVNFRDAEAAFDRTYLPYWKMVHEVPNKIAPVVHTQSPDSDKWAKGFAEAGVLDPVAA